MGTVLWLPFLCICGDSIVAGCTFFRFLWVTLWRMLMDTLGYFGIAIFCMLMRAGRFWRSRSVSAVLCMFGVMFTHSVCCRYGLRLDKGRRSTVGNQHCAAEQQAYYFTFCSHVVCLLLKIVLIYKNITSLYIFVHFCPEPWHEL